MIARRPSIHVALLAALALAGLAGPARAGEVWAFGGGSFAVRTPSYAELRFHGVVQQRYDYSCGSASVATLLTYQYREPTTEGDVFDVMWRRGDQDKIRRVGFSLLDMKRYLDGRGFRADGFRVPLETLREADVPAITMIDSEGYKHFVVLKGVGEDYVLLGDPALGARRMHRASFEEIWTGISLVVRRSPRNRPPLTEAPEDWPLRRPVPLDVAFDRDGVAPFTLWLPGLNEF